MLLTVKKQIEETLELKTPAYYKDIFGHSLIKENGQLVVVKKSMIYAWDSTFGYTYTDEIARIVRECEPCEKEEFDKIYAEAIANFDNAVACEVEF